MKKFIVDKCINVIQKKNKYNDTKMKEIRYGLEGIYLTITKLVIISIIAAIVGIFKEMVIYICLYNIVRIPSFGLHATKSWICLLSSTILFIGIPFLCLYLNVSLILKCIIGVLCIIFMYKNSPADTKKRPIINKKRRKIYKLVSTFLTIVYFCFSIFIKNQFLANCFMFSIIMQNFMISPLIYRIFKLPYNNYITFLKEHPDFIQ